MAFARTVYTGNGATLNYSTGFSYNLPSDVQVLVNGALQTLAINYTIPSVGTVTFVIAPANGARVVLRRATSQSTRQVDYQNATLLTEETLDLDSLQAFQMAQEALDQSAEKSPYLDEADYAFNANSLVIKNLANPVNPQDAATKQWVLNTMSPAGTIGTAAGTSFSPSTTVLSTNVQAAIQEVSDARIRKNYIINGGCKVAQRALGGIPATALQFGAVDRFLYFTTSAASAGSGTQAGILSGAVSKSSVQVSGYTHGSAGAQLVVGTVLESKDVSELGSSVGSLQVRVFHDCPGSINYSLELYRLVTADTLAGGITLIATGSTSVSTITSTLLKLENISLGATATGLYARIVITTNAQTTRNFTATDWQLERGAKGTEPVTPLFATELAQCKRYYESSGSGDSTLRSVSTVSAAAAYFSDTFNVEKRVSPTMTYTSGSVSGFPATVATTNAINAKAVGFSRVSNATVVNGFQATQWIADAEIT